MTDIHTPKLFISYCWSNPEHEAWTIKLATRLIESGVNVILDKWDLKEGQDANAFMEQMVTDPTINKVAMISDETYVQKADQRSGGVGTETQIITPKIYSEVDQSKFVLVIAQRDSNGQPYVPAYYSGRIFIDLSDLDNFEDNFEKLLRWIFDKPMHVKPSLGKVPSYLTENEAVATGNEAKQRRLIDAVQNGKPYVNGALSDYFDAFSSNLERYRITLTGRTGDLDEVVKDSIDSLLPARNEFSNVLKTILLYSDPAVYLPHLHRFFEQIFPYMYSQKEPSGSTDWDYDNYKFVVHELFVITVARLIKTENFAAVSELLEKTYYIAYHGAVHRPTTVRFTEFRSVMRSFIARSERLHRLSARADLLVKRTEGQDLGINDLMQADFVLYIRGLKEGQRIPWWPETLLYATNKYDPFEMFARSSSSKYFERIKGLLSVNNVTELRELLLTGERLPHWQYDRIDPEILIGNSDLLTRP